MVIDLPPIPIRPNILAANIATAIIIDILLLVFWKWDDGDKDDKGNGSSESEVPHEEK